MPLMRFNSRIARLAAMFVGDDHCFAIFLKHADASTISGL
jgi:hypothetical protein